MATEDLDNSRWQDYFDRISRHLGGERVYVEVAGLGLGDQLEAEWLPLNGLTYDPKNDLLEVSTDVVDHLIRHPNAIRLHFEPDGLHDVEVVDGEGNHQIIRLQSPVALPRAQG